MDLSLFHLFNIYKLAMIYIGVLSFDTSSPHFPLKFRRDLHQILFTLFYLLHLYSSFLPSGELKLLTIPGGKAPTFFRQCPNTSQLASGKNPTLNKDVACDIPNALTCGSDINVLGMLHGDALAFKQTLWVFLP